MPGSVAAAAPATVFPWELVSAFRRGRTFATERSEYADGRSHRRSLVTLSRRRWPLSQRLKPVALGTLRAFYEARNGSQETFYFYDVHETSPLFTYDQSGVATVGRYTVRFDGGFGQQVGLTRGEVSLALLEVA